MSEKEILEIFYEEGKKAESGLDKGVYIIDEEEIFNRDIEEVK